MIARLLAAGAALLLACGAHAQDRLDAIRERLAQQTLLRGEFSQEKRLAGFRNPLRSSGRFVLARKRGIVWDTLQPFASSMVVTADRIRSRLPDGSARVEVDVAQQPALGAVNATLFALFAGELAVLSERFDIEPAVVDGARWTLGLTPKAGGLAEVFVRVDLEGDAYVREVRIEERGGDITRIAFDALRTTPAELSEAEARAFD
ncbi:outer membrane lipoprotein carrier protein LolA [Chiayiivirga flava]|uniref:Outer membrane lipoprotein-sorting protein n=1 Tax=Chiayiivirga flava TaxID=659595 RepID=A0A7W8D2R6_9GAMM|nr:outer membrane lipoprotein carrier protein LolA [Chiayiivirga flava]MBB5206774.1 outer membrane lipoprotein-sorting protein [Chiayiivirga flava]